MKRKRNRGKAKSAASRRRRLSLNMVQMLHGIIRWGRRLLFALALLAFMGGYWAEMYLFPEKEEQPTEQTSTEEEDEEEEIEEVQTEDEPPQTITIEDDLTDLEPIDEDRDDKDIDDVISEDEEVDTEPEPPEKDDDEEEEEEENNDEEVIDVTEVRRQLGEDDGKRPVAEEMFTGKLTYRAWRNPKVVEQQVAGKIRAKLGMAGYNNIPKFLSDPETRLLLAQWHLLHASDMDELTTLLKEGKAAESLAPLLNDLRWMSSFVYDGELRNPEVALAMIYHFRQVDPDMDRDVLEDNRATEPGMKRRIAAAVAAEFTRNHWYEGKAAVPDKRQSKALALMGEELSGSYKRTRQHKTRGKQPQVQDRFRLARERYLHYSRSWDNGQLNSSFGTLPGWLLRITCGWKGNTPFGTASTMKWLRDNVSVPLEDYRRTHELVPYLPTNKYGDYVHSQWYYQPFDVLYPGNFAKEVRDIGGVCLQLSHFGAAAACSNGVPAVTLSEPGHCSYAVYFNEQWYPSNSFSDNRFLHINYWDFESYNDLQVLTEMFRQGQRTRDTQMVCTLANLMLVNKSPRNAQRLYEIASIMQPLYTPMWGDYLRAMGPTLSRRPRKYLEVCEFFCSTMAPQHPALCARYLQEYIYPAFLERVRLPGLRLKAFLSYINNLHTNEKRDWKIDDVLEMQYSALGKPLLYKQKLIKAISDCVQQHADFMPAMGWAIRRTFTDHYILGTRTLRTVEKMLDKLSPDNPDHAAIRRSMHASIIRATEDMAYRSLGNPRVKDIVRRSYINIVNKYSQDYVDTGAKSTLPAFKQPGSKLVSPGALVMLSSYRANQESLIHHAAALTPQGGCIQSEHGNHVKLTIEFARPTIVGSIVVVPNRRPLDYTDWFVEYSMDGKTWNKLCDLPNGVTQPYVSAAFPKPTRVKFLRIDSGDGITMAGIDFKAVLIYDNNHAK